MNNAIRFLETLASSPAVLPEQYAAMISQFDIDDAERDALLDRDAAALSDLLGGRPVMRCSVFEPSREPDQAPDGETPDEQDQPDEDKSSSAS